MGTVNDLDTKYMTLQIKYDSLHSKFEQLQLNHTSLEICLSTSTETGIS